jgi:hypothetical protein
MALAAVIAIAASFFIATKTTLDRRDQAAQQQVAYTAADRAACARINKLYSLIQKQVRLSLETTPKLTYYKRHPKELAVVLNQAHNEIRAFAPTKCT